MKVGLKLAFTGAVNDEVYDLEQVTGLGTESSAQGLSRAFAEFGLKFKTELPETGLNLMEAIGRKNAAACCEAASLILKRYSALC